VDLVTVCLFRPLQKCRLICWINDSVRDKMRIVVCLSVRPSVRLSRVCFYTNEEKSYKYKLGKRIKASITTFMSFWVRKVKSPNHYDTQRLDITVCNSITKSRSKLRLDEKSSMVQANWRSYRQHPQAAARGGSCSPLECSKSILSSISPLQNERKHKISKFFCGITPDPYTGGI